MRALGFRGRGLLIRIGRPAASGSYPFPALAAALREWCTMGIGKERGRRRCDPPTLCPYLPIAKRSFFFCKVANFNALGRDVLSYQIKG